MASSSSRPGFLRSAISSRMPAIDEIRHAENQRRRDRVPEFAQRKEGGDLEHQQPDQREHAGRDIQAGPRDHMPHLDFGDGALGPPQHAQIVEEAIHVHSRSRHDIGDQHAEQKGGGDRRKGMGGDDVFGFVGGFGEPVLQFAAARARSRRARPRAAASRRLWPRCRSRRGLGLLRDPRHLPQLAPQRFQLLLKIADDLAEDIDGIIPNFLQSLLLSDLWVKGSIDDETSYIFGVAHDGTARRERPAGSARRSESHQRLPEKSR